MSEDSSSSSSIVPKAVPAVPSGQDISETEEGKQKEDKANIEDRRSKKKMQNRIAQRGYRQRMKVRVAELESTLDTLKRTLQREHGRADPVQSNRSSTGHDHIPLSTTAPILNPDLASESHTLGNVRPSPRAPVAQMEPPLSLGISSMLAWDETTVAPIAFGDAARPPKLRRGLSCTSVVDELPIAADISLTTSMHHPHFSLHSSPFELNSPANFDSFDNWVPNDYVDHSSTHNVSSMPYPNNAMDELPSTALHHTRNDSISSSFSAELTRLGLELDPITSTWEPTSASTTDAKSHSHSLSLSKIASPAASSPIAHTGSNDQLSRPSTASSIQDRLNFLTDQAKLVGFPDLDALIMAYYTLLIDEDKGSGCENGNGNRSWEGESRRLPVLITTLRYAMKEWRDWQRRGFPLD